MRETRENRVLYVHKQGVPNVAYTYGCIRTGALIVLLKYQECFVRL